MMTLRRTADLNRDRVAFGAWSAGEFFSIFVPSFSLYSGLSDLLGHRGAGLSFLFILVYQSIRGCTHFEST